VGIYIGEAISAQISNSFRKTGTSWRVALRAIGIVGLVLAILLRAILREPPRQSSLVEDLHHHPSEANEADPNDRHARQERAKTTFRETVSYVIRMRSFWLLAISAGLRQLGGVTFGYYMPSYLQLLYPNVANFTSHYGIIVGVVGSFAVIAGGYVSSVLWRRTVLVPLYMTAIGGMISSIFVILMVFSRQIADGSEARGSKVLYGVMTLAYLTAELWLGAFNTLFVFLLPPRYKTFALAIYMTVVVFIYSSGPAIVGLALRKTSPKSPGYLRDVRVVLAVIIPAGYWIAGIGFLFAVRLVRQDLSNEKPTSQVSRTKKLGLSSGVFVLGALVIALFVASIVYR
jgi:hypothetical protein